MKINNVLFFLLITSSLSYTREKPFDPIASIQFAYEALAPDEYGILQKLFFSPNDQIKKIMLGLIHNEHTYIYAALYRVLDKELVAALSAAAARGVQVVIITDNSSFLDKYEKVTQLQLNGVEVRSYNATQGIMHNKFFIFGSGLYGPLVVTGSANATVSGYTKNQENVLMFNAQWMVQRYLEKFNELKQISMIPLVNLVLAKYKKAVENMKKRRNTSSTL